MAKRIFCVTTAFLWGIFIGFEMVKIDISYLDFKTDVLNLYYQEYDLKIYVPNTLEEQAKKMYEEQHKEEVLENGTTNIDSPKREEREEGEQENILI